MAKLNVNKLGLILGLFMAILHALWAIAMAFGAGEVLLNWILPLHFLDMAFSALPFNILNAIILIIVAFISGYIMGVIFAGLWNLLNKK